MNMLQWHKAYLFNKIMWGTETVAGCIALPRSLKVEGTPTKTLKYVLL